MYYTVVKLDSLLHHMILSSNNRFYNVLILKTIVLIKGMDLVTTYVVFNGKQIEHQTEESSNLHNSYESL